MSTKTTFKRVALVAVAALGFGMLSAVPSSAVTGQTPTSIQVGTIPSARVGATAYVPVTLYLPSASVVGDTVTINAEITSAPLTGGSGGAASTMLVAYSSSNRNANGALLGISADTAAANTALASGSAVFGGLSSASSRAAVSTTGTGVAAATSGLYAIVQADLDLGYKKVYIAVTPDVAGSYGVLVSANSTGADVYAAAATAVSSTFTLTTGTAPTAVTLTKVAGSTILAGSVNGALVKVTLTGGVLSGLESLNVSTSGSGAVTKALSGAYTSTTANLVGTDFVSGAAYVRIRNTGTTAETISLSVTGTGTLSSSVSASTTFAVTATAGSSSVYTTYEAASEDALYTGTDLVQASSSAVSVSPTSTSQTFGMTFAANTAAKYGYAAITDTSGIITGVATAVYDQIYTAGISTVASGTTVTVPANFAAAPTGTSYGIAFAAGATGNFGISGGLSMTVTSVARTNAGGFTITPNSTFIAAPGAAITLTAALADQYGAARVGQTVTITTTGRNNPAATTAITNADGEVTFTTADASTSTTALVDTVSFAATGATTSSVTINYGNTAVGTVTVTGGNTTASVTALTNTEKAISVGSSTTGAEAGAQTVTATVKDANGNALAGIAVTFSVAGTTAAFKTNTVTGYTAADGTASGSLYAWANGTYTYTATAGGKSTTGTMTFASITASNTRVVSATVSGNVVTGKAVDRFGNPVKGATLYASTTGGANIGGAFVTSGTTLSDGTISWVVSGSGSVTVSAVNPADPAGTTAYQTCALAGNATCATASTAAKAYTAATAGTATTAEKNVGSTFAPAGVASATVGVDNVDTGATATDAAAEATDAANAATDAANAAAEAADAATAAAQDAADAVAALSAQVASLISGLKSQLTALTNLVIKIQKKVKA